MEVAARAVGADQHQGMDRIAGGLLHLRGAELGAGPLRPRHDLVGDRLADLAPVAIERGDQLAAWALRPVGRARKARGRW